MPRSLCWLLLALLATGCTNATQPDRPSDDPKTLKQSLGEASIAYWFAGDGAEPMPSYDERVAWHLINQVRMNTDVFDVRDMDGNLIPPAPPLTQQTGMTEAGRWQGQQSLINACYCVFDSMSMSYMSAAAGGNPLTCCTAGYLNGTIRCVGPVVGCGDDGMMESTDRWGLLNKGPGEIRSEIFWTSTDEEGSSGVAAANWFLGNALGSALNSRDAAGAAARTSTPIIPDQCKPPEDTCEGGTCKGPGGETDCDPNDPNAPNECIGQCEGGMMSGEFCTLPEPIDPVACDPANFPRGWYWSFLFGQTSDPTPFLSDVIHIPFEGGENLVLANYFDPTGDPQSISIVTDSSCNAMTRSFDRPGETMGGADMGADGGMGGTGLPYAGNTYQWSANVTNGCIRYVAEAIDAEGFEHIYPTFGSLGMQLQGGNIVSNDDTCPIWSPTQRPNPGCLPSVDECTEGATRLCYTGRPGTEDKGMCDAGTETCRGGRWSGVCEGQVLPEGDDVCGDDTDNNCNGFVDEDCPVPVQPKADTGMGGPDMGAGAGDTDIVVNPGGNKDDSGGCCATVNDRGSQNVELLLLIGLIGLGVRRRR